jgi:hypothetical protein
VGGGEPGAGEYRRGPRLRLRPCEVPCRNTAHVRAAPAALPTFSALTSALSASTDWPDTPSSSAMALRSAQRGEGGEGVAPCGRRW